tara:strand:+ start:266 stop:385 length:120 start_codon:yes stop_codon:yes gene_type:complete
VEQLQKKNKTAMTDVPIETLLFNEIFFYNNYKNADLVFY